MEFFFEVRKCFNINYFSFLLQMIVNKIVKSGGAEPSDFEKQIGQALLELEMNGELKQPMRELYITRAREVEFSGKKVRFHSSRFIQSI